MAAMVTVAVIAVVGSFRDRLLQFVPDDAFYYFEIARRISLGQGSTFDGINYTNGYHPFWLVVLSLTSLLRLTREAEVRLAMVLGVIMLGAAVFFLRAVAGKLVQSDRWVALLLPASALSFATIYGLESQLAALLFAVLLWQVARSETAPGVGRGAIVGMIAGGLVLARLDSALYVIALDLIWIVRLWRRRGQEDSRLSFRGWLACLVAQVAVVTPYLAFNLCFFRHVLPISAVIKSERSGWLNLSWAGSLLAMLSVAGLGAGLIAGWLGLRRPMKMVWQTALVGSGLTLVLNLVAGGKESYSWYFTLPVMCTGLFVCVLVSNLKASGIRSTVLGGLVMGCGLIVLASSFSARLSPPKFAPRMDRAHWIAANAPAQAVFAEGNCGILGHFSQRPFINLDGLANSFSYEQSIRDDRVADWLRAAGFNAVALPANTALEPLADGSYRMRLVVSGVTRRTIRLALRRWDEGERGAPGSYIVWRVIRIEDGA